MTARPPPATRNSPCMRCSTRIGIARDDVRQLAPPAPHGRELLVSEALRPAATTERWQARATSKDFDAAAEQRARIASP